MRYLDTVRGYHYDWVTVYWNTERELGSTLFPEDLVQRYTSSVSRNIIEDLRRLQGLPQEQYTPLYKFETEQDKLDTLAFDRIQERQRKFWRRMRHRK